MCVFVCELNQEQVDDGIEADGSNLSGVSGQCLWEDTSCKTGADSSHQSAAPCNDDDEKENCRRRGDRDKPRVSCDGLFPSRVTSQMCYNTKRFKFELSLH